MSREPLHTHEQPSAGSHARGNRPRAIDARRRRSTLIAAVIAAVVLIVVLLYVL